MANIINLTEAKTLVSNWQTNGSIPNTSSKILAWKFSLDKLFQFLPKGSLQDKLFNCYLAKNQVGNIGIVVVQSELNGTDYEDVQTTNYLSSFDTINQTSSTQHSINNNAQFPPDNTATREISWAKGQQYVHRWENSGSLDSQAYNSFLINASIIKDLKIANASPDMHIYLGQDSTIHQASNQNEVALVMTGTVENWSGSASTNEVFNMSKPCPNTCPRKKLLDFN